MEDVKKVIVLKTKGFEGKDDKGLDILVKHGQKFIETGELCWAFADYMGYSGSGKGGQKHADVVRQLTDAGTPNAIKLLEVFPQIDMRFASKEPISFKGNSASLRAYFQPLLKARGEVKVEDIVEEVVEEVVA